MKYNDRGEELPDDTPIEVPLRFKRPPTLQEQIKAMVQRELSQEAVRQGFDSFEDADDFDVDDDGDLPPSNYEFTDMPIEKLYEKKDASKLDKSVRKEDDVSTVNRDRIKENENVQQRRVDDDRKVADSDGEVSRSAGGKG